MTVDFIRPEPLAALAARARAELELFDYPPRPWVIPRRRHDAPVLDVVVCGGGQNGLGAAAGLQQARVPNVLVLDENPVGRAGPWVTYARMRTLRTVKTLPGPALKVPSLSFRRWYEAQHGTDAWDRLVRIPKAMWAQWLDWLAATLAIPIEHETRLDRIEPVDGLLRLEVVRHGSTRVIWTRKVVLATGSAGAGGPNIPTALVQGLPHTHWAHSADAIDFRRFMGGRVAVLGGGASAFDNAATALEAGAARVDLYMRRATMPEMNSARFMEFEGLYRHYAEMHDAVRWRFMRKIFASPMPPPPDTFERCTAYANFHLHLGEGWERAALDAEGRVAIETNRGSHVVDFAVFGTGFAADLARRPELAAVLPHVALWSDRYRPPEGEASAAIGRFPYLGPGFEFLPREPGTHPELADIHLFNGAALPSIGPIGMGINGVGHGIERLVRGITRDFYLRDQERYCADFMAYETAEAALDVASAAAPPSALPTPSPT